MTDENLKLHEERDEEHNTNRSPTQGHRHSRRKSPILSQYRNPSEAHT